MTTIPTKQAAAEKETITARFQRLAATWHKATDHLSSMSAASSHPAHQGIISLGKEAVPLLLRDLEDNHTHWFIALREITGSAADSAIRQRQYSTNGPGLASVSKRQWLELFAIGCFVATLARSVSEASLTLRANVVFLHSNVLTLPDCG